MATKKKCKVSYAPHQRETCFRNKIYPEYKATRPPVPEDLSAQFPYVRDISAALGMLVLQEPGVEADDTIGTLAAMAGKENVSRSTRDGRSGPFREWRRYRCHRKSV